VAFGGRGLLREGSVHLRSGLIRWVAFGGRGLLREGSVHLKSGLIRWVAFVGRGLLREGLLYYTTYMLKTNVIGRYTNYFYVFFSSNSC
jgi:hypothetical protein